MTTGPFFLLGGFLAAWAIGYAFGWLFKTVERIFNDAANID